MHRAVFGLTLTVLFAASVAVADGTDVRSPQAQEAIQRRDKQVAAAEAAYKQALVRATSDCIRDLKVALNITTRQGNLDDAVQIKAEIVRLQGEVDGLTNKLRQETFTISATTMWNKTVTLTKGQVVRVQAVGQWSPNGAKNLGDVTKWPPRGRINDGTDFSIGADRTFAAEADGVLQIGIDDGNRPNTYNDNLGSVTVVITFFPKKDNAAIQPEKE
jgi:hypothetical protein